VLDRIDVTLYYSYMNGSADSAPDEGMVMFSFLSAAHALEDRLDTALAETGLSMPKLTVLTHLVEAENPVALSALADRLSCVRSNITQLVDRLEADGLVRRVADPSDRRSVRAALTPLGRDRQAAGARKLATVQGAFTASLSAADQVALARVLAALK
jgi:DNA-binding MarR family transcriptional regulator